MTSIPETLAPSPNSETKQPTQSSISAEPGELLARLRDVRSRLYELENRIAQEKLEYTYEYEMYGASRDDMPEPDLFCWEVPSDHELVLREEELLAKLSKFGIG